MSHYELFQSQTTLVISILVDTAKQEIRKAFTCNSVELCSHVTVKSNDVQTQLLNSIMETLAKEAVRKICSLFRYCSGVAPVQAQMCLNNQDDLRKTPRQVGRDLTRTTYIHNQELRGDAIYLTVTPLKEPAAAKLPAAASHQQQLSSEPAQEINATRCLLVEDGAEDAIQTIFISEASDDRGWSGAQEIMIQAPSDQPETAQEEESFECDQCGKAFPKKFSLLQHKRVHSIVWPHSCEKCGKKFTLLRALETHLRKHTQKYEKKKFPCSTCGKSFRDLAAHELVHAKVKPFTCDICGQGFTVKRSLYMHQRVHTGEKPYSCDTCGKCFSLIGTLNAHKKFHSNDRPIKCSYCNKCFKCKSHLRRHLPVHTGEKRYTCKICSRQFAHSEALKRHILIHTGEKPYICEVCGNRFRQRSNLKVHMQVHAETQLMFGKTTQHDYLLQNDNLTRNPVAESADVTNAQHNNVCGKFPSSAYSLKASLLDTQRHSDNYKPFTCKLCERKFRNIYNLRIHEQLHTGEKPFKCEICGKAYALRKSFKTHMFCHSGEKPHKCIVCGKTFRWSTSLKMHMQTHTDEKPHKCETCGKSFHCSGNLKRHKHVHSEEKPFSCKVCGEGFGELNNLKVHMHIHTGVKPYTCQKCGKNYAYLIHYNDHKCKPG